MRRSDMRTPLRVLVALTVIATAFSAAALTTILIKNYPGFSPTPPITCTSTNNYFKQKYGNHVPFAACTVGAGVASAAGLVQSVILLVLLAQFNRQTGDEDWDGLEGSRGTALAVLWSAGALGSAVAGGHYLDYVMERNSCGNSLVLQWLLIAGFGLLATLLQAVCLYNIIKLRKTLPKDKQPAEKLVEEKKEEVQKKVETKKTEIAKEEIAERKIEEKPLTAPLLKQREDIYQPKPVEVEMMPIPKPQPIVQKPIETVQQRPKVVEKREEPEPRSEIKPTMPRKQLRQQSQIQFVQAPQPQPQLPPLQPPQPPQPPPPVAAKPQDSHNNQPTQNNTNIHFHFTPNGIVPTQQPPPQPVQEPSPVQPVQPLPQPQPVPQPVPQPQPQIIFVPEAAARSKPKRSHRDYKKDIIAESREEELSSDSDEKYYKRARKYKKKRQSMEKYRLEEQRYREEEQRYREEERRYREEEERRYREEQERRYREQQEERYKARRNITQRNYEPPYHYPYPQERIVVVAPPLAPPAPPAPPTPPAPQLPVQPPPPVQPQHQHLLAPPATLQHHKSSHKLAAHSPSRQISAANISPPKLSLSPQANIQISLQPRYQPIQDISPISKQATLPREQPTIGHRQYFPDSDHQPLSRSKIDSLREENLVETLKSGHFWEEKAHSNAKKPKQKGKLEKDKNSLSQYIEDLNESYSRLQLEGAQSDHNYSSILSQVEHSDRRQGNLSKSQARQALLLDRIRQKYS